MNFKQKPINITLRYFIVFVSTFNGFYLFYFIFAPLTVYPTYFLLNIFFNASLLGNGSFLINGIRINLIEACIAPAAYFLLFALNVAIPKIKSPKRIKMILTAFSFLLLINIFRIFFLVLIFFTGTNFFDVTHKVFWYALSTIFVVGIWILEIKIYKIRDIPFYTDVRYLFKQSGIRN